VGASSNRVCVTCPIVAMVRDVRVLIADVGAGRNRTCAMCPIVTTDEARPLLLGHHSSNGTAPMNHLPLLHRVTNCCYRDNIVIVGTLWHMVAPSGDHGQEAANLLGHAWARPFDVTRGQLGEVAVLHSKTGGSQWRMW
jgi:hypothetical protein